MRDTVVISVFWVLLTFILTMMGVGKMPVYLKPAGMVCMDFHACAVPP